MSNIIEIPIKAMEFNSEKILVFGEKCEFLLN